MCLSLNIPMLESGKDMNLVYITDVEVQIKIKKNTHMKQTQTYALNFLSYKVHFDL